MTNLALLQPPTADQRRKLAEKLAAFMPRDAAHGAASLLVPTPTAPGVPARPWTPETHECGLPAIACQRVRLPFVDPNHINFGRLLTEQHLPRPTLTSDGILTVTWPNLNAQDEAIKSAVAEYVNTHELIPQISNLVAFNGLDSWHSPLVLVPVRHEYGDGTDSQTRWMAADGTARIVAFRQAVTTMFPWLVDHPYQNSSGEWKVSNHPYQVVDGNWNGDGMGVATWRSFLSIARVYATAEAQLAASDPTNENGTENLNHPEWFMQDERFTCDWGTLILPDADTTDMYLDVESWLMRSHRQEPRETAPELEDKPVRSLRQLRH